MLMSLAPELSKISVDPKELFLDPNNPRLFTTSAERCGIEDIDNPGIQSDTEGRIADPKDRFKITELKESIRSNGYTPEAGGYIFVRKLPQRQDSYLVLEGNRRLIAIRQLAREIDGTTAEDYHGTLNPIDVLEIVDDIDEIELQKKISYLLGTCHHGSHKDWTPFAQARGIHERYIELAGQDEAEFVYAAETGKAVGRLLSVDEKEVRERLSVYRAMRQLSSHPSVTDKANGGIIGSYYSLIKGAVHGSNNKLKEYLPRDPNTFHLTEEAVDRLINLCKFDGTRLRPESAVNNDKQWGFLAKILADDDEAKRSENLARVESQEGPEQVWAERSAELRAISWKKWLEQVVGILKQAGVADDFSSEGARTVIDDLQEVVTSLENQEGAGDA
jgi:hypothetical protein